MITSIPATSPKQPDKHLLNCQDLYGVKRSSRPFQPEPFSLKTKIFRFKQLTSSPAIFPTQPCTHLSSYQDLYGKHPCPYGALPHPKDGSCLVKIRLPG